MADDTAHSQLEQAEQELQDQLDQERHPPCPACGCHDTRRRNSVVSVLLILVTLPQMVFLYCNTPGFLDHWIR